jgi:hypothetical protein
MDKNNGGNGKSFWISLFWPLLFISCIISCVAWTWLAGKDLNWDSINYHYYIAYQWVGNRLRQDFLAASIQSYLNPVAYLPFYGMVRANWHSLWIGSTLAAFHAVNLLLVGLLSAIVLRKELKYRRAWIAASVLLAAINPIFVIEIGSTFNDISSSVFVLAGYVICFYWLVVLNDATPKASPLPLRDAWPWALAGLLLGMALGLKLTNLIFAIALLPLIFAKECRKYSCLCRALFYTLGGLIGFSLVDGYWAWRLWKEFGNPIFPYANGFFLSPDFPAFSIRNYRFIPETISDVLFFPLDALRVDPNIYTETNAPDSRFLVLAILLIFFAAKLTRKKWRAAKEKSNDKVIDTLPWLIMVWLLLYILWFCTSGNGRYFLPGLLLLGPIIVALFLSLNGARRISVYGIALLIGWQIIQVLEGATSRWSSAPWTQTWFEVQVPKELIDTAYLYLAPATQTSMFIAPFLNSGSAFSNIGGQVPLTLNGPGGKRLQSLLKKYGSNIRSLYPVSGLRSIDLASHKVLQFYDGTYDRFGLQTDPTSCALIGRKAPATEISVGPSTRATHASNTAVSWAISCHLVPVHDVRITGSKEAKRVDYVFDKIERKCPRRFDPAGMVTKKLFDGWARTYVNSDFSLLYSPDTDQLQYRFFEGGEPINLGALADWEDDKTGTIDCSVKKAPPFRPVAAQNLLERPSRK